MYLMKIKGNGKIPVYLQVRDDSFTLIAYFRADKITEGLKRNQMLEYEEAFKECVDTMEFGSMKYLENIKK